MQCIVDGNSPRKKAIRSQQQSDQRKLHLKQQHRRSVNTADHTTNGSPKDIFDSSHFLTLFALSQAPVGCYWLCVINVYNTISDSIWATNACVSCNKFASLMASRPQSLSVASRSACITRSNGRSVAQKDRSRMSQASQGVSLVRRVWPCTHAIAENKGNKRHRIDYGKITLVDLEYGNPF